MKVRLSTKVINVIELIFVANWGNWISLFKLLFLTNTTNFLIFTCHVLVCLPHTNFLDRNCFKVSNYYWRRKNTMLKQSNLAQINWSKETIYFRWFLCCLCVIHGSSSLATIARILWNMILWNNFKFDFYRNHLCFAQVRLKFFMKTYETKRFYTLKCYLNNITVIRSIQVL